MNIKLAKSITNVTKNIYVSNSGSDSNGNNAIDNIALPLLTIQKALDVSKTIDDIFDVNIVLLNDVYNLSNSIVIDGHSRKVNIISENNNRNSIIEGTSEITTKTASGSYIYFETNNLVTNLIISDVSNNLNRRKSEFSKLHKNNRPFNMYDYTNITSFDDNIYILRGAGIYDYNVILTSTAPLNLNSIASGYPLMETVEGGFIYKLKDTSNNEAVSNVMPENIHLEWAKSYNTQKMKVEVSQSVYNAASAGEIFTCFVAWESYKMQIVSKQVISSKYYLILERNKPLQIIPKDNGKFTLWNSLTYIQQGEYVSNKNATTGKFDNYYFPKSGETISNIRLFNSSLKNIITIKNSKNISIKNISIYGNSPYNLMLYTGQAEVGFKSCISIEDSKQISISGCKFSNTYDYSVKISGGSNISIKDNFFNDIFGGAIYTTNVPDKIEISNNIIKGYGNHQHSCVGIFILSAKNIKIFKNDICDGFYSGISIGWGWADDISYIDSAYISENHIHHLFKGLLTDGAGIYTIGKTKGILIENNYVHDIVGSSTSYSAGCVYYDQGTTQINLRNNILFGSVGIIALSGHTNKIENNIIAYPISAAVSGTTSISANLNAFMKGNIIMLDRGDVLTSNNSSFSFVNNLIVDLSGLVVLNSGSIINNNYLTSINPFTSPLTGDFSITQAKSKQIEQAVGFLISNKETNGQINNSYFKVNRTSINYGVSNTMWAYIDRDISTQTKIDLKAMYVAKFGNIGAYFN